MGPKRVDVLALDGGEVPRLGALDADHGARQVVDALRTAQAAEDIPPPYQTRPARPGECGWMRSVNRSMPTVPSKSLTGSPRNARSSRSTRSFEKSSTSCVPGY